MLWITTQGRFAPEAPPRGEPRARPCVMVRLRHTVEARRGLGRQPHPSGLSDQCYRFLDSSQDDLSRLFRRFNPNRILSA